MLQLQSRTQDSISNKLPVRAMLLGSTDILWALESPGHVSAVYTHRPCWLQVSVETLGPLSRLSKAAHSTWTAPGGAVVTVYCNYPFVCLSLICLCHPVPKRICLPSVGLTHICLIDKWLIILTYNSKLYLSNIIK